MIQLLFFLLFAEGAALFFLLVKIGPLRDLVMRSLDQVKAGKGPATVKTVAGTMSVILLSSFMSIVKIQNKGAKLGTMSPMDQVLWRTHLLEASLMGMPFLVFAFSHGLGVVSWLVSWAEVMWRSRLAALEIVLRFWMAVAVGFLD
ncbi:hypothetical protein MLD38_028218 [Melastoma candidum]|uniref:Uncharacterized protein n=1 Tax=Melastoma candidum TaxID=119954 RepID=A0ACB9N2Q2_9MYRT|nr:hypothetical protein MLD38_028218 [Melastoma candidum]